MTSRFTVAAGTAVVGGIAILGLPFVRPALDWPTDALQTIQDRQVVDASGRITGLDSQSVTIAPTVLGFNGRRFVLDEETRILVGDKEGGIGDLQIGANVAVIYEPRPGGFLARWLGVNLDRGALHRAALRSETPPAVAEPSAAAVPEPAAVVPGPAVPGPAAVVPERAASTTSQPRPAPTRRVSKPVPRVDVGVGPPLGPPAPASSPKPEAAKTPAPAPSNREGDDPGAVIDWLLRNARGK
jgi:hypothetical protein